MIACIRPAGIYDPSTGRRGPGPKVPQNRSARPHDPLGQSTRRPRTIRYFTDHSKPERRTMPADILAQAAPGSSGPHPQRKLRRKAPSAFRQACRLRADKRFRNRRDRGTAASSAPAQTNEPRRTTASPRHRSRDGGLRRPIHTPSPAVPCNPAALHRARSSAASRHRAQASPPQPPPHPAAQSLPRSPRIPHNASAPESRKDSGALHTYRPDRPDRRLHSAISSSYGAAEPSAPARGCAAAPPRS